MTDLSLAPRVPRASFYGDQFSPSTGAQTRVNASTFQVFKQCPRKYLYGVLLAQGKGEDNPDLRFGTLVHAAKAVFEHNRARGMSHDEALQGAFRYLLHETWNHALAKPGFADDPLKNRTTLLRTFVWYVDQYRDDACETARLPSGKPAVEIGFEFDSGCVGLGGEQITFVGTLDRIVRFNGATFVADTKTSASARFLTAQNYTPDGQFSLYVAAASVCFGIEADGILLDGIAVGPNSTEFRREIVPRPRGVIEEWLRDQRVWLRGLTEAFAANSWPQNDAACGLYGGCRFRGVCGATPELRADTLARLNGPPPIAASGAAAPTFAPTPAPTPEVPA